MDFKKFWDFKAMPLWNAYKTGFKNHSDAAERYFVDVLKLIISLSTGLLAFMVAIQDKILKYTIILDMYLLLFGFILAIFFAVCSFVLLAINYKAYADRDYESLKNLYKNLKNRQHDLINKEIQDNENTFLRNNDTGWQKLTMFFGISSFALFLFSTFYLVHLLLIQSRV